MIVAAGQASSLSSYSIFFTAQRMSRTGKMPVLLFFHRRQ